MYTVHGLNYDRQQLTVKCFYDVPLIYYLYTYIYIHIFANKFWHIIKWLKFLCVLLQHVDVKKINRFFNFCKCKVATAIYWINKNRRKHLLDLSWPQPVRFPYLFFFIYPKGKINDYFTHFFQQHL